MSEIKSNSSESRGGKRPGAGRKPSTIKGIAKKLPPESAELILAEIKANQMWVELAKDKDSRIKLETLKYLTDRAYGKAKQAVTLDGSVTLSAAERAEKVAEIISRRSR